MIRRVSLVPAAALVVFLVIATASDVQARGLELHQSDSYTLGRGETLSKELWLAADMVTVRGLVLEDFIAYTGKADLRGTFEKDVWVAGRDIEFSGSVKDSARFLGLGPTKIEGRVEGNLIAVSASTVHFSPAAHVTQDALVVARTAMLQGPVEGHLEVWATQATIGGVIGGNLHVRANDIVILPGTRIEGDLIYTASRELALDRSVAIGGNVRREILPASTRSIQQELYMQLYLFGAALMAGLAFTALFPRHTGHAVRRLRNDLWKTLLTGAVGLFAIPLALFLAAITLIGLPLAGILGGAFVMLLYCAKIIVGVTLGSLLLQRRGSQPYGSVALSLATGLLLLYFFASLPIVGGAVSLSIVFFGLGALLLSIKDVQFGR